MTTAVGEPTDRVRVSDTPGRPVGVGLTPDGISAGSAPREGEPSGVGVPGPAPLSDRLDRILARMGPFDADACMSCGMCTATCPLGIDVLPRRVLRYATLGLDDQVRAAGDAIFSCLLCRACEVSCPAGVHITEDIRLMRRLLLQEGW